MKPRVVSQEAYDRRHPPKTVVAPHAPKTDPTREGVKAAVNAVVKAQELFADAVKHIRRDADIIPVYGSDKRLARIEIRYK